MTTETRPDRQAAAGQGARTIADEIEALRRLAPIIEAAADDPIHPALSTWLEARRGEIEALRTYARIEAEEDYREDGAAEGYAAATLDPAHRRVDAAYRQLAMRTPTTPAGLIAQLRVALNAEASQTPGMATTIVVLLNSAAVAGDHLRRQLAVLASPAPRPAETASALAHATEAAWAQWQAAHQAKVAAAAPTDAEIDRVTRQIDAAGEAILAAPAKSLTDLERKLEVAAGTIADEGDSNASAALVRRVLVDLRALAGEGS